MILLKKRKKRLLDKDFRRLANEYILKQKNKQNLDVSGFTTFYRNSFNKNISKARKLNIIRFFSKSIIWKKYTG